MGNLKRKLILFSVISSFVSQVYCYKITVNNNTGEDIEVELVSTLGVGGYKSPLSCDWRAKIPKGSRTGQPYIANNTVLCKGACFGRVKVYNSKGEKVMDNGFKKETWGGICGDITVTVEKNGKDYPTHVQGLPAEVFIKGTAAGVGLTLVAVGCVASGTPCIFLPVL